MGRGNRNNFCSTARFIGYLGYLWTLQHRKLHQHCDQLFSFFQVQWSQSPRKICLQPCLKLYCKSESKDMAKQLLTPLRLIVRMNFLLKTYGCGLFNLIWTVGKVELILTFTTAVWESWNVSDKCTWDNAGDLKQLSMDQTLGEDNWND